MLVHNFHFFHGERASRGSWLKSLDGIEEGWRNDLYDFGEIVVDDEPGDNVDDNMSNPNTNYSEVALDNDDVEAVITARW